MNQVQTAKTTKSGTSKKFSESPATEQVNPVAAAIARPKPKHEANLGRLSGEPPKKAEFFDPTKGLDEACVIDSIDGLEQNVALAKAHKVERLLVTKAVMSQILKENYKNDIYMMYKNITIVDEGKLDEYKAQVGITLDQKLHGDSKLSIAPRGGGPGKA